MRNLALRVIRCGGLMHDAPLSRLPSHHTSRPRLTSLCADQRIVVVEAAGGYGKSVLAAELADIWGVLSVWVPLEAGGVSARLFAARLRVAVAAVGLTDAAGAIAAAGDDPGGAIDAMLRGLAGESCAIVIDDAHHADPETAGLIDRIGSQLDASLRLIVLARHLPAGLAQLRRAPALHLGPPELALTPEERRSPCAASDSASRCRDGMAGDSTS